MRHLRALCLLLLLLLPALAAAERPGGQSPEKFARVERFKQQLPRLRAQVSGQLDRPKLDRRTAVAAIIRIMDAAYVRVGSARFTKKKDPNKKPTYGASSLLKRHVTRIDGDTVHLKFRGKSGKPWKKQITDPQLAGAIRLFMTQPGQRLFQTPGRGGKMVPVRESHVGALIGEFGGQPKDFRTLHANRLLDQELTRRPRPTTKAQAERNITAAIKVVAGELNHGTGVCRSSYLDQRKLTAYAAGLE